MINGSNSYPYISSLTVLYIFKVVCHYYLPSLRIWVSPSHYSAL